MYMECDLMENSIKIKNVDEDGNEIENVDWSKWKRERVEEVFDGNNNLVMILSYCKPFSEEEVHERLLNELAMSESADIEAALCELAEQQATYEHDVNAALCELYELIAGGENNG